jgi:hypothetical protein
MRRAEQASSLIWSLEAIDISPPSVSGEYKTAIDMAGEFAGVASHVVNGESRQQVGLYISE